MSFKFNLEHLQNSLFGIWNMLPESQLKRLKQSKESSFYDIIFVNIDESLFSVLYNEENGRPNTAINIMIGAIILHHHKSWTCEELFNNIYFNLLTKIALGIDTLDKAPFCPATYFNFQNRLLSYYNETGINLLEKVFDGLTESQLKKLGLKTDICRVDSFQAMLNIAKYSRVQLLVEVLIRLYRILEEEDKKVFSEILKPYIKSESHQYLYKLNKDELPSELEKLSEVYHMLYEGLKIKYSDIEIFKIFERVYTEHFKVVETQIQVKETTELHSGCLQSPDDVEATYRKKKGEEYRGQVVNVCETANPENPINLINDIAVEKNNIDDSNILNNRIDIIKEKNPDLNELHTDGAYGSEANDDKMDEHEINHIPTGVRGRSSEVEMKIEKIEEGKYQVSCAGGQAVESEKTTKRNRACFDAEKCAICSFADKCPTVKQKKGRVYYFSDEDYKKDSRNRKIKELPAERRKIRNNVEATMKEFTKGFNHKGKLKIRGYFKTVIFAIATAIGINFGRIHRYQINYQT